MLQPLSDRGNLASHQMTNNTMVKVVLPNGTVERTFYGRDPIEQQIKAKVFCKTKKLKAELHVFDTNQTRVAIVSVP